MSKKQQSKSLSAERKATYFVKTYGCQMNLSDSELIGSIMNEYGYRPAAGLESADVILVNTCSVREHAEQRALGRIRSLSAVKKERPDTLLGVVGCMAENFREELLELVPGLDIVAGPDSYRDLPRLIDVATSQHTAAVALRTDADELYDDIEPRRDDPLRAWMAVSRGCDNRCTYCIVPSVRGPLRSRPARTILRQVSKLADDGLPQVCLLGQNVNAYHDGDLDFADLLDRLARQSDMPWIRFLTSHPADLNRRTLEVMAAHDSICNHLHLPLQSGSDRILKAMGRGYSVEHYINLVSLARELMPDLTLTTDIIVGFPGEDESDFQATLDFFSEARFDSAFTFIYSPRSGTPAARMESEPPREVKLSRLERLMELERDLSRKAAENMIGSRLTALVEGRSKYGDSMKGRTAGDKIIVFSSNEEPGRFLKLRVTRVKGRTLVGAPVDSDRGDICG